MGHDIKVSMKGSDIRQQREVMHFVPHPEFSRETMQNDVAVIRVSNFIEYFWKLILNFYEMEEC